MIHALGDLNRFTLDATDGDLGEVKDTYFDDEHWAIRYLIVDTGKWLPGRKVLISPFAVRATEWARARVDVNLTRQQVKTSPDIDTDKPVSRQHEADYFAYYGYPPYWAGPGVWGATGSPIIPPPAGAPLEAVRTNAGDSEDSHLRSTRAVVGYHIQALDGTIGHVEDFLFDEDTWQIRHVVVDTRNWWPGKHVLIPPQWIDTISWIDHSARVRLTRTAVKESPPYDPKSPLPADYEAGLYRHYGRNLRP
jgi:sporulation protein YlmC with PRC-barrel domain